MKIQLDMYQTLAAAVLVLLLGNYLRKKINFLEIFTYTIDKSFFLRYNKIGFNLNKSMK